MITPSSKKHLNGKNKKNAATHVIGIEKVSAKVWISVQNYDKIFKSMIKFAKDAESMCMFARIN